MGTIIGASGRDTAPAALALCPVLFNDLMVHPAFNAIAEMEETHGNHSR